MPMLDIFSSNAFGLVTLTERINQVLFQPGRIGELGLFQETSSNSTSVAIEEQAGMLVLIPPTPRGGPGVTLPKLGRGLRILRVPHFEINDAVMAEEVQGVRAFGSETDLETVVGRIMDRDILHTQSMAVTQEFSRLGALTGVVTYADGTSLDLFAAFSVTQEAEVDFDLDNATPVPGALRAKCDAVVRLIAANLGGIPFRGVHAFVGDAFYNDLVAHTEVREVYLASANAMSLLGSRIPGGLSASSIFGSFQVGSITFENYRGSVGAQAFINTDKAYFFPTGISGFAKTVYAPADYNETVNTMGRRLYQLQYPIANGKGIHLDTQMNALEYVTRPKALIKGRRT